MAEFIAPLALGTWVVNVLSGSTLIFTAIAAQNHSLTFDV